MAERGSHMKIFTLQEANALLPQVRALLASLRDLRSEIVALQGRVDVEEITGLGSPASSEAISRLLTQVDCMMEAFHSQMADLRLLGCELKDLERGLVDFPADHEGKLAYYCWMDGEEKVCHWHGLDEGFSGRRAL